MQFYREVSDEMVDVLLGILFFIYSFGCGYSFCVVYEHGGWADFARSLFVAVIWPVALLLALVGVGN